MAGDFRDYYNINTKAAVWIGSVKLFIQNGSLKQKSGLCFLGLIPLDHKKEIKTSIFNEGFIICDSLVFPSES